MLLCKEVSNLYKPQLHPRDIRLIKMLWFWLLFGVKKKKKMLTQHISGPVSKYKLLYVSKDRAGARVRGLGLDL